MLKEDNIYLHDMIRMLIDIEMSVINGKYENAYYLLGLMSPVNLSEFFMQMRNNVKEKLFEFYGDKHD